MAAAPPAEPPPAPTPDCSPPECPALPTPDTRRCPLDPVLGPSCFGSPAHSTASSPTTATLPTTAPSAAVERENAVCGGIARLLFFSVLGEIRRRRGLRQYPGHDLICQGLKGLMNLRFQISKLGRLVPQLGHPFPLLLLQLLLHLPQHFIYVFHHWPALSLHTHFHTPPLIHRAQLACQRQVATLSTTLSLGPFLGIGPKGCRAAYRPKQEIVRMVGVVAGPSGVKGYPRGACPGRVG